MQICKWDNPIIYNVKKAVNFHGFFCVQKLRMVCFVLLAFFSFIFLFFFKKSIYLQEINNKELRCISYLWSYFGLFAWYFTPFIAFIAY